MCIEVRNKYVESRKDLIRKYISKEEMNKLLTQTLNEHNIKFKNDESKAISKKYLYAIKITSEKESKLRSSFYKQIKDLIKTEIEDLENILDSFLIFYPSINKTDYLILNY